MAIISSPIKTDAIPTDFDAKGNKSGDADYGKNGPNISLYAEAQVNGDTHILNDKGVLLATIKYNTGTLDASTTIDPKLLSNLDANKRSYLREAADKIKQAEPTLTEDAINKHFGGTPVLTTTSGALNLTAVTVASASLNANTRTEFIGDLSYPKKRDPKLGQDYIRFTIKKYEIYQTTN